MDKKKRRLKKGKELLAIKIKSVTMKNKRSNLLNFVPHSGDSREGGRGSGG
jgi:hypothetical protein